MTGGDAMVGTEHRWAYAKAVDDINAKGGVFVKELNKKLPIKLIVVDDKSSVPEAAAAAEKLIKLEKVDFLLGTCTTPYNLAAATVAEKYKMVYVATTFWPTEFLDANLSWAADSFFHPYKLLLSSLQILDPIPVAERPKNVCVMVMDNPDGHAFGGGAKAATEEVGYRLALYEAYPEGAKDYSASILRMRAEKVDALVILCSSADGITLIRQMKEAKLNLKYIWGAKGFWPMEFAMVLGADSDYIVSDAHWNEALGYPGAKELQDRFRADFAGKTSATIGNFYSIVQALAQAIEQAGSLDPAKVRDVFYSGTFVAKGTTNGDLAFSDRAWAEIPPVGFQWMKAERMPAYPRVPEVWTIKLMPPWEKR